jgi:hypothetical protein
MEAPNCRKCIHRHSIPGDTHSQCDNWKVNVTGDQWGIDHGWFNWPFNFDPIWLVSCDGFEKVN